MEEQKDGVAVTPNEEAVDTAADTSNEESNQGQSEATGETAGPVGKAEDGTEYTVDSPEVVAFKEIFPDVADDAAIGSVISMHDTIAKGGEPAGDGADKVVDMIKVKLGKTEETTGDAQSEEKSDGEEAAGDQSDNSGEDSKE